jgi:hypothetical protein
MSEGGGGSLSVFRVTRLVKRTGAAARGRGGVSAQAAPTQLLSIMRAASIHPVIAAAMIATMAFASVEPYLAVALGQQTVMPLDPITQVFTSPQATADRQRQWTLQHIYGTEVGNQIYQQEWSHRADEIDLRTKVP